MTEKEPKYLQVIEWVKEEIASGRLKSGDKLMSENEMCETFGLSRQTVRHATGELEKQRLVTRVRGSGTYIGDVMQQPRGLKYHNVALISTFFENYIIPSTIKGMEHTLSENGFTMQLSFTDNQIYRERAILTTLLENDNVDGVIAEPAKSALPNPNLDLYRELRRRQIPVLFINAEYPELSLPCIRLDDEEVGRKAAKLLIDAGHTTLGGIFKSDDRQGPLRYAGFLKAALDNHIVLSRERVIFIDSLQAECLADIEDSLLKRLNGATGVVCYNDLVANQLIGIANSHGIRVPEELSVVGLDDVAATGGGLVPLTTIPHPKEELGCRAAQCMIRMISEPDYDGSYLYNPDPIRRLSVLDRRTLQA